MSSNRLNVQKFLKGSGSLGLSGWVVEKFGGMKWDG
jgi:hypothetical protein